ncbi:group II intron maturase-specific domain-containing protein [Streptomyces sp. S.PB5]|uniref:group II intron maturase-specific domain-containing protein n=1 Tax=Streptomyces sp. S.PB5 TaxID=3020844 RepID=UPI0025AF2302|nr:group II intron maturase-specific domain-containing protein [Streptomyces sp. S.PB5]MDN3021374.1 group II intron maturase-specific domain-containing protein [Streptomyces sp. S.PB5]
MVFTDFLPAISKDALKKISREVRSWRLHMRMHLTFFELARRIDPSVRGWMQYFAEFYRSELHRLGMDSDVLVIKMARAV